MCEKKAGEGAGMLSSLKPLGGREMAVVLDTS